jgi:hypothetical protein
MREESREHLSLNSTLELWQDGTYQMSRAHVVCNWVSFL